MTHSLPETGSLINANNTLSDEICRKTFRCKDSHGNCIYLVCKPVVWSRLPQSLHVPTTSVSTSSLFVGQSLFLNGEVANDWNKPCKPSCSIVTKNITWPSAGRDPDCVSRHKFGSGRILAYVNLQVRASDTISEE